MTQLTGRQVAAYWEGAGGPANRAVEWLAICMGESSLFTDAVSWAGAVGLWQIMPFNAPTYGYTTADLYDPHVNARIAVLMSGGGTNCAAWDSCYANIVVSGRYRFLAWPEPGSADAGHLAAAAAMLGGAAVSPAGGAGQPGVDGTLAATITGLQNVSDRLLPAQAAGIAAAGPVLSRLWR